MKTMRRNCTICCKQTEQTLQPNSSPQCNDCGGQTPELTQHEMLQAMLPYLQHEPPLEITDINPGKYRVFIKHHLGEAEVPIEQLKTHLRLKGELPAAGEKLYALPPGINHKAFAIPIAEVIRVEAANE